jgi:hypothetical protein
VQAHKVEQLSEWQQRFEAFSAEQDEYLRQARGSEEPTVS